VDGDDPISATQRILWDSYARIYGAPAGRRREELVLAVFRELRQNGHERMAHLFLQFDAVMKGLDMDKPNVTYNFNNATVANANFGTQIGTITASIESTRKEGGKGAEFATALKTLTEGVINAPDLTDKEKKDALEVLELLGGEAQQPADKRKQGIVRSVLDSMPKLLSSASALVSLWHTFGPHITSFFDL
jgi:hypothetical protein